MNLNPDNILLIGSILLIISILAGKTSVKFGVPTLIFFLLIGILAGSEGIGGIHFDDAGLAQLIGITALNFILFSGGLDTNWKRVKPILWRGVALSTLGVFITALSVGLFVHYFFDFTLLEGLLLGSIVSATDAAAVFSILRGKGIRLKGSLGPVLELESGSNDPMAYFLTISLTNIIKSGEIQPLHLAVSFLQEFIIGGVIGYGMGRISQFLINKIKLNTEGLYPVLLMGLAVFTYAGTHFLGGNGFLATYLCAIVLGNRSFIHKRTLTRFYEGQAWLWQIILFLALGLLVFPSRIIPIIGVGLLIAAFLIFIARPLGVFISLVFFKTNLRSKLFISWVGLRGGIPIVFATYPLLAGLEKADMIFNLVFFISVSSVLLQGTSLATIGKLLHVILPDSAKRKDGTNAMEYHRSHMQEIEIQDSSPVTGKKIVDLDIESSIHIMSIKRKESYIQPVGSTRLLKNDTIYILVDDQKALEYAENFFKGSDQKKSNP
ncbi:MAG: potassium/proton antiporter [Ferruginibacter sp.]